MPLLNVRFISCRQCLRSFAARRTGLGPAAFLQVGSQCLRAARAGMFSSRPPPVMWARVPPHPAMGERPARPARSSHVQAGGFHAMALFERVCRPAWRARCQRGTVNALGAPAKNRWNARRWRPGNTTSPGATFWPVRILTFSAAPTAKPARSYSPAGYMPGISAVSPPISATRQFAALGNAPPRRRRCPRPACRRQSRGRTGLGALHQHVVHARHLWSIPTVSCMFHSNASLSWCPRRRCR